MRIHKGYFVYQNWCEMFILKLSCIQNKDENVNKFSLSAIRGDLLERERDRDRKKINSDRERERRDR